MGSFRLYPLIFQRVELDSGTTRFVAPMLRILGMTSELQLQQPLFPLDRWGCESVFVVVDRPHPNISRAIVGPLILGRERYSGQQPLRCIALHSEQNFLFSVEISAYFRTDPDKFWAIVASHFGTADPCLAREQLAPFALTPEDSVKHWSGRQFWMSEAVNGQHLHKAVYALSKLLARRYVDDSLSCDSAPPLRYEDLAQTQVNDQLTAALQHLFRAMAPELREAYTRRPRLSTGVVNRLLALAQVRGDLATKSMLQAIQTEAFGLLHLMAFGDGCPDAQEVLQVVFSGGSLPTKFAELGVSKGVHRRTLFRPEVPTQRRPFQPFDISGLRMPGVQWLSAMRLTQHKPVNSIEDWNALGHLLEQLQLLALSNQSLNSALLEYCVKSGYKRSGAVLKRLCINARALIDRAEQIIFYDLAFEYAIQIALEWEVDRPDSPLRDSRFASEPDWTDSATLRSVICRLFALDADCVMQSTLNTHPGIPTGFSKSTGLQLLPLDSINLTFLHGNRVKNCLRNFYPVARYIADGVALYGVYDNDVAIGTIALKRDIDEREPKVEVLEISGRSNNRAGYQLGHLAQSLADKWNADFDNGAWAHFSSQCRRLSPFR